MECRYTENEIYFDNNATTKPLAEVKDAMVEILGECFGNPSSANQSGQRARKYLNDSRSLVAKLLGCDDSQIVFTSSGTESNNMAFYSATANKENAKVITTNVEHSSIRKMCSHLQIKGVEVITLEVEKSGLVDTDQLEQLLKQNEIDLVSVQWVNNETGIIQNIKEISELCNNHSALLHTDCAQAVGKIDINLDQLNIDFLSFTGHKINGPQGSGALYAKDKFFINPILFGGFQEDGFRPGTENLPGIVGLGVACKERKNNLEQIIKNLTDLRNDFEQKILNSIPEAEVNSTTDNRVCNTSNIRFNGVDGRQLLSLIDSDGIRCSQSSACTNFETSPSYVLMSMGLTEEQAYSSIRFSFGVDNTFEEVDRAVEVIKNNYYKLTSTKT